MPFAYSGLASASLARHSDSLRFQPGGLQQPASRPLQRLLQIPQ